MNKKILLCIIIIIIGIFSTIVSWFNQKILKKEIKTMQKITIATIPNSFTSYFIFVAIEQGYFKNHGLDIKLKPYPHGKATINAVINHEVQFAVSSETPFMRHILEGKRIYVFASTITAQKHLALVARKDRGINTIHDIKGKTIGVTKGSNGEYFMDMILVLNDIPKDLIKIVDIKPGQMYDALVNGKVDAVATWNPLKYKIKKKLGDKASVFYVNGIYSPSFIISANQDYVHTNPDIIERLVQSLYDASRYIQNYPDQSRNIVAKYLKINVQLLNELTATYHFVLALDQALILKLEDQAKWAVENKLANCETIPNFFNFIYTDALEKIAPENMTIIK